MKIQCGEYHFNLFLKAVIQSDKTQKVNQTQMIVLVFSGPAFPTRVFSVILLRLKVGIATLDATRLHVVVRMIKVLFVSPSVGLCSNRSM